MTSIEKPIAAYRMRWLGSTAAWEGEWSRYEQYFRERGETALLLQPLTAASPPEWLLYHRGVYTATFYSKPAALRALAALEQASVDGIEDRARDCGASER